MKALKAAVNEQQVIVNQQPECNKKLKEASLFPISHFKA
jgi:hypothetical protein